MVTRLLVYHVASGHSFFTGVACLILAVGLSGCRRRGTTRIARNALVSLGILCVLVSATPMPGWWALSLGLATIGWVAAEATVGKLPPRFVIGSRGLFAFLWVAAILVELPYHFMPAVPKLGRPTLGIVADSVTAGTIDHEPGTWPGVFAARHRVTVHDHSRAGATVASAIKQAASISEDERLVLLEIGGNDILGGTTPEAFEAGLSRLLKSIQRPGRVVVMLELPLPPSYNAFGQIQRGLARRTGALLVPKRVLLGQLQQEGSTIDTIHLTAEGHRRMADTLWEIVKGAFNPNP